MFLRLMQNLFGLQHELYSLFNLFMCHTFVTS